MSATDPKPVRRSSVIVPEKPGPLGRLTAFAIWSTIRGVDATLRFRLERPAEALRAIQDGPCIFAIWHNRLFLALRIYQRFVCPHAQPRRSPRRMAAVVSASRDGGLLARILELFDVEPVRGSTSRRGPQAMLELVSWAEKGFDLAITPDGPRGPRCVVQEGVVVAAKLTRLPVIPVCFRAAWKYQLKSWDRFQIPLPGSRADVVMGQPLFFDTDSSPEARERDRCVLQERLMAITPD
jgi:hypothetical protein